MASHNEHQPSKAKPQPMSQLSAVSKDTVHPATPTSSAGPSVSHSGAVYATIDIRKDREWTANILFFERAHVGGMV